MGYWRPEHQGVESDFPNPVLHPVFHHCNVCRMTIAVCRRAIDTGGCVVLVPGLLSGAGNSDGLPATGQLCRLLALADPLDFPDGRFASIESILASVVMSGVQADNCAAVLTHQSDFPQSTSVSQSRSSSQGPSLSQSSGSGVLRSDPAYQQIDMNNATLGNPAELTLTDNECTDLQQTLNQHFAQDGIRFEYRDCSRWYCHFDNLPDIVTTPVSAAIGRDVAECRPSGADARVWRSKLAEIEMLLFEHPVNVARQERGQLPVNTLWIWGEGKPHSEVRKVEIFTDNFYTTSFANYFELSGNPLPDHTLPEKTDNSATMFVIDKFTNSTTQQNHAHYIKELQWFEQSLCSLLWRNLATEGWPEVVLWCGDNHLYQIKANLKKQFWRRGWLRPKPLSAYVPAVTDLPDLPPEGIQ